MVVMQEHAARCSNALWSTPTACVQVAGVGAAAICGLADQPARARMRLQMYFDGELAVWRDRALILMLKEMRAFFMSRVADGALALAAQELHGRLCADMQRCGGGGSVQHQPSLAAPGMCIVLQCPEMMMWHAWLLACILALQNTWLRSELRFPLHLHWQNAAAVCGEHLALPSVVRWLINITLWGPTEFAGLLQGTCTYMAQTYSITSQTTASWTWNLCASCWASWLETSPPRMCRACLSR